MPTNTSIEQEAVSIIEGLARHHGLLDPDIKVRDKNVSYDGYITGYTKAGQNFNKADWEFSVPVQVKGHVDKKNERCKKYLHKSVDLTDLRIYFNEHGALYFQVLMDATCQNAVVYYANLTPSKSKTYLDEAEKRHRKTSITVKFYRLKLNPEALYSVLKQFNNDSKKQSYPIVSDTLRIENLQNVHELTANVFGAKSEIEAMMKIADGEVGLFGTVPDNRYEIPVEFGPDYQFGAECVAFDPIEIGGQVFYEKYLARVTSGREFYVIPSDNIEMCLTSGKTSMKFKSDLSQLYHDALFITAYLNNPSMTIGQNRLAVCVDEASDEALFRLKLITDAYEALTAIGIDTSFKLSELSEEDSKALTRLVEIRNGERNDKLSDDLTQYIWRFSGKYVPIFIKKAIDNETTNTLYNALYSPRQRTVVAKLVENPEESIVIPVFMLCSAETLANLYKYDFDAFYAQIDQSTISEKTIDMLTLEVLKFIRVYDMNGDEHFLHLADYLAQKTENVKHHEHFAMNRLQIRKRLRVWGAEEIAELNGMVCIGNASMFGKNVLLGNKDEADRFFGLMSAEEQEQYRSFPIFTLYEKL